MVSRLFQESSKPNDFPIVQRRNWVFFDTRPGQVDVQGDASWIGYELALLHERSGTQFGVKIVVKSFGCRADPSFYIDHAIFLQRRLGAIQAIGDCHY